MFFFAKFVASGFFNRNFESILTRTLRRGVRSRQTESCRGGEEGGATRSARIDCVCCEAVEARTKMACLGFSTALGARFSSNRFVRAFLGFLCCQK